jgi:hypothetical protein
MAKPLLIFFSITLLAIITGYAQTMDSDKEHLYFFNHSYIDLNTLQIIEVDGIVTSDFKTAGKFHARFEIPLWFRYSYQVVIYENTIFEIINGNEIKITDRNTNKESIINYEKANIKFDSSSVNNFLIATSHGVLHIRRLKDQYRYFISKYDRSGNELFSLSFEYTPIADEETSYPYLDYFMHTDTHMVFTSYSSDYKKTCVIDLEAGTATTYEFTINGVIRAEDEKKIIGFIQIDDNTSDLRVIMLSGNTPIVKVSAYHYDTVETVLVDDVLYAAEYSTIDTGSTLRAFNLKTGELVWKADVKQLHAEHSQYYNKVYLSLHENRLILEGIEAQGIYLQIFDIRTGERLYVSDTF